MMKNSNVTNPIEEQQDQSFSFGHLQFVSDRQEEDDNDDDDDDGAYIEISLHSNPRCDKDHVFPFRLSFSRMLPRNSDSDGSKFLMPAESVNSNFSDNYTCSFDSSSMSSCSTSSTSSAVLGRSNAGRNHGGMVFDTPSLANKSSEMRPLEKGNKWRKAVQLLATQRVVNLLMLSLRSLPEHTRRFEPSSTSKLPDEQRCKVHQRKRSLVSKAISSGLMKLTIKFRTIKTKSKMSLTRASNVIFGPTNPSTDGLSYSCYEKSPVDSFTVRERKRNNEPRLHEVSINSIKGVIDSLTVSCPASVKSSPIHRNYPAATEIKTYTRENSIQAAIAHCKMSWS